MIFIPPNLLNEKDPEKRKYNARVGLVMLVLFLLIVVVGPLVALLVWGRG